MLKKVAILIDGGCLRVGAKKARKSYTADYVERVALLSKQSDEEIFRVLYYDCAPFSGKIKLPISGSETVKSASNSLLSDIAKKPLFATRTGILKFRGFELIHKPGSIPSRSLTDKDFREKYEQKGVDMRIGLDMAIFASNKNVDRVALLSNDTDCIPAMKHVRRSGLQVTLITLPGKKPSPELLPHCDQIHPISAWP